MESIQYLTKYFVLFFLLCTVYSNQCFEFNATKSQGETRLNSQLTDLFTLAKPFKSAVEYSNINSLCKKHYERYLEDLEALQLWALKMYDATAKWPSGILNGNVHQNGDYTQCVDIDVKFSDNPTDHIQGKFCQILAFVQLSDKTNATLKNMLDLMHSHHAIRSTVNDYVHFFPSFSEMSWSFCVPSSCSPEDLQTIVEHLLYPYNQTTGLTIQLKPMKDNMCDTKRGYTITTETVVFLCIVGGIVTLSIIGFIYDCIFNYENYDIRSQNRFIQVLFAFSLRKNFKMISDTTIFDNEISCLHGIRTIFSFSIYFVHRGVFGLFRSLTNRTEVAMLLDGSHSMIFRAFWNHVDTFVILSGLLTSYYSTLKLQRGKKLNIPTMYLKRYLKFAPVYILLILGARSFDFNPGAQFIRFCLHWFENCRKSLWRVVFMLDNINGMEDMCYPSAHQLITDWQMYLIAPFIIKMLWKLPHHAVKILTSIFIVLGIYKAYVLYSHKLTMVIYNGVLLEEMTRAADAIYLNPLHRLTPYLFGVGLGHYLCLTGRKNTLTGEQMNLGWCISITCAYYAFFGPIDSIKPDYQYEPISATLYGVLQPILWSVAIGWVVYVCHTGRAPWLNAFLSWKGFVFFSRIAYAFYIMQIIVIFWFVTRERAPVHNLQLIDLNEIALLFFVSILTTMLFIFPINDLYFIFTNAGTQSIKQVKPGGVSKNSRIEVIEKKNKEE